MSKFRLTEELNMDRLRRSSNPVWNVIQNYVFRCFGKLATIVWGEIRNDEYLKEAYIRTFDIEKDRNHLIKQFERDSIGNNDIDFIKLSQKQINYAFVNILKSFDDLKINQWIESSTEILMTLLGDRGTGKSTFIAYLLKNLSDDTIFFVVNLGNIKTNSDIVVEMYQSLTKQIDDKVRELGAKNNLNDNEIFNTRFHTALSDADAHISHDDTEFVKIEKERRKSIILESLVKYKSEFNRGSITYLLSGMDFIRKMNKRICIIFDDADRLNDFQSAEIVRRESQEIMETLKTPVILSLREITTTKMGDRFERQYQYHILPPSFRDLLNKRVEIFIKEISNSNVPEIKIKDKPICKREYIKFLNTIKDSILHKEENLFMFYMLSNSNIDLMLDFFRNILASPHYTDDELLQIMSESHINQHKILETLLKNIYSDYYSKNTFILNLYDTGEKSFAEGPNNLFRVRILEIIREFGTITEDNRKTLVYKSIVNYLDDLGYLGSVIFNNLDKTLGLLRDFGLLETSIFGDSFTNDTEFYLKDSAYFYLDHLIYSYRYVQTIIPDTYLDYKANMYDLKSDLKVIDKEIIRFIGFIKRCEDYEEEYVKEKNTLLRINSSGRLSAKLKNGIDKDKAKQKSK